VDLLPAPLEREWLATALETVIAARGEDRFLTAPLLLPEDRFFPDRWSPDEAGAGALARRLLDYADLSHLDVSIETFENEQEVHELGLDGRAAKWSHAGAAAWFAGIVGTTCKFGIEISKLDDALGLVAAMAHEVAHAFRHAHRIARRDPRDRDLEEKLTDVTTIYLGFGVLTTAATARFITRSHDAIGSSYSHRQQGYLAPHEMAYLLAMQLAIRGYDDGALKAIAKRLPANQAASLRAARKALNVAHTADMLGFSDVPAPQPSPLPATSWWRRLFG
jgi:hypothetical protein